MIFIPKKINVGFQNRKDTYTGKLAYVIYYDEDGKRCECDINYCPMCGRRLQIKHG